MVAESPGFATPALANGTSDPVALTTPVVRPAEGARPFPLDPELGGRATGRYSVRASVRPAVSRAWVGVFGLPPKDVDGVEVDLGEELFDHA